MSNLTRDEPILLFFSLIFLSTQQFFFSQPIMLNVLLKVVIFCSKFSYIYIANYLTMTSYTHIPKLSINIIDMYSCSQTYSKCQLLTRPNVLIVLLEYIDLFNPSDNMKQSFGRGCPVLYHSTLLYFILSVAIVANQVHFAQICSYYASILLFAFAFLFL